MDRRPPMLDMTPDGQFRSPPPLPGGGIPLSAKVIGVAAVVAVGAAALSLAAVAVWLLAMLLPVAIVAGVVAYVGIKYRRWRGSGGGGNGGWPRAPGRFGQ